MSALDTNGDGSVSSAELSSFLSAGRAPFSVLCDREKSVVQLIAEGLSVKEAAALLGISTRTVEFHKYSMMESLGLKNSAELMRFAVKHGIK